MRAARHVAAAPKHLAAPSAPTHGVYVVRSGDYLSKIAANLGVKGGWQALYAANRSVVGANPNLVFAGQQLRLP